MTKYSWLPVTGFGAHIKSTQKQLIVQKKKATEYYPIDSFKHLLIVGGHTINSTTVSKLIKNGVYISFFDPDGSPVGTIQPFGSNGDAELKALQQSIPRHRYAIAIAEGSIRSRLLSITRSQEAHNTNLFYEGELEFLKNAQDELGYLIKLDEIRRLHRMTSDMYYEIMARDLPPDWGFRRRTERPHTDPVNAMLSFGYAMLYGTCSVSVIGAFLDPDIGLLHDGKGSLIQDLIEPLKAEMVDRLVFQITKNVLKPADFELTADRCILSENLLRNMIDLFYTTIIAEKLNEHISGFCHSLKNNAEFRVQY
ncbi:CRISPR-associated endonuclease Cas1 [uncultured Methanoregula sp.]|uniref:CRISPR-associated endonuclease Cas1 n=1 Tax=uncultured Methanoregula sp. TaxID=1005933 RepID=UPI002AABD78E|nr:CRISPR-associated endonuclease Cas1 [uncultured Methanoregula sp.]